MIWPWSTNIHLSDTTTCTWKSWEEWKWNQHGYLTKSYLTLDIHQNMFYTCTYLETWYSHATCLNLFPLTTCTWKTCVESYVWKSRRQGIKNTRIYIRTWYLTTYVHKNTIKFDRLYTRQHDEHTAIYKYISTSTFILTVNIQQTYMLRNMISTCIHLSDTTSCTRKSWEIIRMKMKSTRLHTWYLLTYLHWNMINPLIKLKTFKTLY